jgi:hypothetical protein
MIPSEKPKLMERNFAIRREVHVGIKKGVTVLEINYRVLVLETDF